MIHGAVRHIMRGLALAVALCIASSAWAQEGDGSLHVLRPVMNTEQEQAEICLEFDAALENGKSLADRQHLASELRLESKGVRIPLTTRNVSVNDNVLCVSPLDHQRDYRLSVADLRGTHGERMAGAYSLSFAVPDRTPLLTIASGVRGDGVLRAADGNPVLRSLNVPAAQLELYRVTDPAAMRDAWQMRLQVTLAPSESLAFVHAHGQMVWQGSVSLGDELNKNIEHPLALEDLAGPLPPGLYLLSASAVDAPQKPASAGLAPLAAKWVLRSDMTLRVQRVANGFYAMTEKADASAVLPHIHISIEDQGHQLIAEANTDVNGVAVLPIQDRRWQDVVTAVAAGDNGNIDFSDVKQAETWAVHPADVKATLESDRPFYAPGDKIHLTLALPENHERKTLPRNTSLHLVRADGAPFAAYPVTLRPDGVASLDLHAPVLSGVLTARWQEDNGHALGEIPLRVTVNPLAPVLSMTADRPALGGDGAVTVTVHGVTADGRPAPYLAGQIAAAWKTVDQPWGAYNDFHFSAGSNEETPPKTIASFLTDARGDAAVHLSLTHAGDDAVLPAAVLTLTPDPATGAVGPALLQLPSRPRDYAVGVKPRAVNGVFSENSLARFEIIALNAEGKPRGVDDLTYQIYAEGRSFEWHQSDGRWDYKPSQQQRRIGGGPLAIGADGMGHIETPVTSGAYRLDISDNEGKLRARYDFGAGWGEPAPVIDKLPLNAPALMQTGQAVPVRFHLDKPALVTAFVFDARIRQVIHQKMDAGDHVLTFIPAADWDDTASIQIEAQSEPPAQRAAAKATLSRPAAKPARDEVKAARAAQNLPLEVTTPRVPLLYAGDSWTALPEFANHSAEKMPLRVTFAVTAGLKPNDPAHLTRAATLNPGQTVTLDMPFTAQQTGMGELRFDIHGSHGLHLARAVPVTITAADKTAAEDATDHTLAPGHVLTFAPSAASHAPKDAVVGDLALISPVALPGLARNLGALVTFHPFTTAEIAAQMTGLEIWHDALVRADLLSEMTLRVKQGELLERLLRRQLPDGSFIGWPAANEDKDNMQNTAFALTALARLNDADRALGASAMTQAANWLRGRLVNNWFDDVERPARAASYAALAAAHMLDVPSLDYFADGSADKSLPPLAAANLSYAFASINDRDRAAAWLGRTLQNGQDNHDRPALAAILAENSQTDAGVIRPLIDGLDMGHMTDSTAYTDIASAMRAAYALADKSGPWRFSINGDARQGRAIVAIADQENLPFTLNNKDQRDLFVTLAQRKPTAPQKPFATHRLFRFNGEEIKPGGRYQAGETVLVAVEGAWPGNADDKTAIIYDRPATSIRPVSCLLPGDIRTDATSVPQEVRAAPRLGGCETTGSGLYALLQRPEGEDHSQNWRVVYLARLNSSSLNTLRYGEIRPLP
jgi:uncharacterized protein YfaS (alpha-2-macroglobulin family)